MRRALPPLLLALASLAPSCSRPAPGPDASASPAEPSFAGLAIDLTPDPDRRELEVTVRLAGERAAAVKELAVARQWAGTRGSEVVHEVEARDARGAIPLQPQGEAGPDLVLALARPPAGEIAIRYEARANAAASRFALRIDKGRASGVGHAFLLLPRLDAPAPVRVRWHLERLGAGARGASSFGVGADVTASATTEEIAHAAYLAGDLRDEPGPGVEQVSTTRAQRPPPGLADRRLVVLGDPAFDPGGVLVWAARAEGAVARFFGPDGGPDPAEPFSFLFVAAPGIGRDHDGVHLTRSIALWLDAGRRLDPELEVVIAHEICHDVIGGRLRLVDEIGRDAPWFSEGFAVHFARRILLRERLLAPEGFLADVARTLAEPDGPREPYRRGALYAASLDAALRRSGKGAKSLDDLVRDLLARARRSGGSLPVSAFRDAVVSALGPAAGDDFDRKVMRGEAPIELPDDAFGPCFHRAAREETVREIGFDPESLRGELTVVRGLVKGSAAEKAGVKEGALVIRSKETRDEIELTIADGRRGKRIRYKPVGKRRKVQWEAQACKEG